MVRVTNKKNRSASAIGGGCWFPIFQAERILWQKLANWELNWMKSNACWQNLNNSSTTGLNLKLLKQASNCSCTSCAVRRRPISNYSGFASSTNTEGP